MSQPDLFGEAAAAPAVYVPKREHVVNRLESLLAELSSAEAWPWRPVKSRMFRDTVRPGLLRWLPEDERAAWNEAFDAELARLDAEAAFSRAA